MNRREFSISMTTLAATTFGGSAVAQSKASRVLILGGTGFIGPHFVHALKAGGHQLTLFNRGKSNPDAARDVEVLIGDRNGQLDALKRRDWDVVIDNSGYVPREVKLTADLLKGHINHYLYISSISAYADFKSPGIDESYPLAQLQDPTVEAVTNKTYGGLKAACEQVVEKTYGAACAIIRPTYIVGPGDPTDRFTYWPVRASQGGEMLAPGSAADPVQFIDVRDLAEFMRIGVERKLSGRYNLCNPPRAVTMGALLDATKRLTKANTHLTWVSTQFLEQQKLLGSGELPLWLPTHGEFGGAALINSERAVAAGLRFRNLDTTVADTLAWHRQRPVDEQKLRAGLTPEREATLLKQWQTFQSTGSRQTS